MASKINITFNSNPTAFYFMQVFSTYLGTNGKHVFRSQRLSPNQVTIGATMQQTIDNYFMALQVDLNASGVFTIVRETNGVSIQTAEDNVFNAALTGYDNGTVNDGTLTFVVTAPAIVLPFVFTNVEYLEAPDTCNFSKVRVTGSSTISNLLSPVVINNVNSTVVEFNVPRGLQFDITINRPSPLGGLLEVSKRGNLAPAPILVSDFEVTARALPTGNILNIVNNGNYGSNTFTYSIDGVNYRGSGTFDGLLAGDYTIYIKDSFNCIKTVLFTIEALDIGAASAPPYFHYPTANPIPMVAQKTNATGENFGVGDLISAYEKNVVSGIFLQPFLNTDRPTLQVHTSYNDINLSISDCDGNKVFIAGGSLSIKNINLYDAKDGFTYTDSDGVLRIYFTTGNTYDEFGAIKVNEGHALSGSLPSYYEVGQFLKVGANFEQIVAIEFNDEFDRSEVITGNRPGVSQVDTSVIVSAYYNEQPYNVYEIPLNFSLDNGIYQLYLTYGYLNKPISGEYYSEFIEIFDELPNHHLIKYWSEGNKGIIYNRGYFGSVRFTYDSPPKDMTTTESEQYQADDRLVSIDDEKLELYEFDFGFVTSAYKRQLIDLLMNDVVFIDGKQYKKVGDFESDRLGTSNRYTFRATMQRQYERQYRFGDYSISQLIIEPFPVGNYLISNGSFVNSQGLVVS